MRREQNKTHRRRGKDAATSRALTAKAKFAFSSFEEAHFIRGVGEKNIPHQNLISILSSLVWIASATPSDHVKLKQSRC